MDDPSQVQAMVSDPNTGAGAGVLTWSKTNWLLKTYLPTAPFMLANPQGQGANIGDSVTLVAVAAGSVPLKYQWYYNTNTLLTGATNPSFTLPNIQTTNTGTYSVIVTNSAGSVTSLLATLTVNSGLTGFAAWQNANFTPAQLADPSISGPNATPAGDRVPNFAKYALGLAPFVTATQPLVGFRLQSGEGVLSYARPADVSDVLYQVWVSSNIVNWTTSGISQLLIGTNNAGLQTWEASYSGFHTPNRFFRLLLVQ
jgi:hypothetical protein